MTEYHFIFKKKSDLFSRAELVIWKPIRRWVPSTCFDSFSYWHRNISSSVTHTQKNVRHSPASKKIINIFQRWTDIVKKYTHTHTYTYTHKHTHTHRQHTTATHLSVVQIFPGRPVLPRDIYFFAPLLCRCPSASHEYRRVGVAVGVLVGGWEWVWNEWVKNVSGVTLDQRARLRLVS